MRKITCCLILLFSFLLVSCSEEKTTNKPITNNTPKENTGNNNSTEPAISDSYENEHGAFEVFYKNDNFDLAETYEDFGIHVSSVEYGVFTVSDAYDFYRYNENKEGKIGYVRVKIAMKLPATLDPAQFFYPHQTEISVSQDFFPVASDNNFADEVAVNLGKVAKEEGYLFFILAPESFETLMDQQSFTLTALAPFTSKTMELKQGYTFSIVLD